MPQPSLAHKARCLITSRGRTMANRSRPRRASKRMPTITSSPPQSAAPAVRVVPGRPSTTGGAGRGGLAGCREFNDRLAIECGRLASAYAAIDKVTGITAKSRDEQFTRRTTSRATRPPRFAPPAPSRQPSRISSTRPTSPPFRRICGASSSHDSGDRPRTTSTNASARRNPSARLRRLADELLYTVNQIGPNTSKPSSRPATCRP